MSVWSKLGIKFSLSSPEEDPVWPKVWNLNVATNFKLEFYHFYAAKLFSERCWNFIFVTHFCILSISPAFREHPAWSVQCIACISMLGALLYTAYRVCSVYHCRVCFALCVLSILCVAYCGGWVAEISCIQPLYTTARWWDGRIVGRQQVKVFRTIILKELHWIVGWWDDNK